MNPKTRLTLLRIGALILVVGLTIALFVYRDYVQKLEAFGYPGIFLVSILSNATLILPVPGVLFTTAMGAVFNPFWIAIAAGSGAPWEKSLAIWQDLVGKRLLKIKYGTSA